MASNPMNKRKTQLLALVSVIILIGMGMTVLLSPSEADPSPYLLTLAEGEDRIRNVGTPSGSKTYNLELTNTLVGSGGGKVELEIINITYFSSEKSHWDFEFQGPVLETGSYTGTYYVPGNTIVPVELKVTFHDEIGVCEKVIFTIGGNNVTKEKKNETHLSPRGGLESDVDYLTVTTADNIDPFWEPSHYFDRQTHYLPWENIYHITVWNLGTYTMPVWISGWEIWRDINEDGIIDSGDEKMDDSLDPTINYFDLVFDDGSYQVGDHINLLSLHSQELKVTVDGVPNSPPPDRLLAPWGHYLIKISVDAESPTRGAPPIDGCEYWDILKACVCDPGDNPDPCLIILQIGEGWNLVSIGVELDDLGGDYDAAAFAAEINEQAGEDIIKYVVRWEAPGQGVGYFEEYVVTSGIGVNFPINEGEGYYVYSISPFEVEFFIVGDCPRDKTFDLLECWNLIGYRSMEIVDVGVWAQMIEDHYGGQQLIQAIVKYDKDTTPDTYNAWYPGMPDNHFQVKPREAYWIFSSTEKTGGPYP